ncbi:MAG: alpha-xylosidase [Betaproteobacteria bacterium]
MEVDPRRFARASRFVACDGPAGRVSFDVAFSDGTSAPGYVQGFGDGVFRLRIGTQSLPDYGLVVAEPGPCHASVDDLGGLRVTGSGAATLVLQQDAMRLVLEHDGQATLESITDEHFRGFTRLPAFGRDEGRWTAAFALRSGEPVYGLGEKFSSLDRRGQLLHSYVEDALGVNTDLSYKNVPFCWSPRGFGVFVNTPGRVVHGVGHPAWSHRSYVAVVEDEALDLFLIAAGSPAEILARYTALTGRAPPLPAWGLGLWVSKAYYKTPGEAIDVARSLRERGIACDVLTLDGRAAWDVATRFDFRFDESRYPDPAAALAKMKAFGLRICVWLYPYVSVHSPRYAEMARRGYFLAKGDGSGEPRVFDWDADPATSPFGSVLTRLPPSSIVDFTNPEAYAFWRDEHAALFEAGVDVVKSDFGEHVPDDCLAWNGDTGRRLHNVYPLLYNRCEYDATRRYGSGAPMVWGRAGWTGAQRYPIQWGGDPQSDWEGMCASIRGALAWGMSGVPFYATDIGGFYGARQPDAELYVRWLQWSVFSSHMRMHGIGAREPWAFGPEALAIARRWIDFRYRLVPYLHAMCAEASASGLPVMRAMPLAFSGDPLAWSFEEQFLCGDCLLVAPVRAPGGDVDVYLPAGDEWIDLDSGEQYAGGQILHRHVGLETLPHFGRVGYVLPLGRQVDRVDAIRPQAPLDEAWVFGTPRVPRAGFAQLRCSPQGTAFRVELAGGVVRQF